MPDLVPTILDVGGLIDRSTEISVVRDALAHAASGSGSTVVWAAGAGLGKSALLQHAREAATGLRFRVLTASPTPVSVGHAHVVVRDWLAPLARAARPGERPFDGPATGLAEALRSGADDHPAWNLARLDYALTWLLQNLTDAGPVLLAVDDVQWADAASLELLDLLSARLHRSRAALVLGLRTGEPAHGADVVDRILRRATVLTPAPLSVPGVERMLEAAAGRPAARLGAEELHRRTGGVPFLVREMLDADGVDAVPRSVVECMADRLSRLDDASVRVARSVAVLGDEASFDALAALCDLSVAALADPVEVLAGAGLVRLGMWRAWPSLPLVAEALLGTMTPSARSDLHRRAADLLSSLGRPRQTVAGHLVHTLPGEDPALVELLRRAGEESLAAGVPDVAARQLLRAVGETRPEDTDPALVARAASAHLAAGRREEACALWRRAQDRARSAEDRARWLTDLADVQMTLGEPEAARESYRTAVAALTGAGHDRAGPQMRLVLARAGIAGARYDGVHPEVREAVPEASARPPGQDTHADRLLCGMAASDLALRGVDREQARALALRALGDGALLREEGADGNGFYVANAVLTWADAYDESLRALDAAVEDSRARGSGSGLRTASTCRGLVHLRQGRLRQALAGFGPALERRADGLDTHGGPALAGAVLTHLALGQTDAGLALEADLRDVSRHGRLVSALPTAVAGLVRATTGDHERALEDYRRAAELMGAFPVNASVVEWRELSVWSLLALDRHDEADRLSAEALEHARRWGAPRALGLALRTRAQVLPPEEAEAHLREALALTGPAGLVDSTARVEVDLGRLLLDDRARHEEAVALLRSGAGHARTAGAQPVARRATRLLSRLGVRLADAPESPLAALTPGERRVVELAASGLTNRQIAQQLVVTVKAVEWHLSNAYRKLPVSSRAQLAGLIYGDSNSSAM